MEPKAPQMPDYTTTPPGQAVFKTSVISQIFIVLGPLQALMHVRRDKSFGPAEFIYRKEAEMSKLHDVMWAIAHTTHATGNRGWSDSAGTDWAFEPGTQEGLGEGSGETEGRASGKGVARQMRKSFCCWGSQQGRGGAAGFTFVVCGLQLFFMCADLVGTGLRRCRNGC